MNEHPGLRVAGFLRWGCSGGLALVLLIGFALRVYRIDEQSLWSDEAISLTIVGMPIDRMLPALSQMEANPPLYHFMLRAWLGLFGFGSLQARMFSAVFGTLAILVLYFLAKRLFGQQTALIAAALLAFSQIGVMFSQEVRPYALLLFLTLAAAQLCLAAIEKGGTLYWPAFALLMVATGYTHYFGLLVLGPLALYALLWRDRNPGAFLRVAGGGLLCLLALAPWLALHATTEAGNVVHAMPARWFSVGWSTIFSVLNSFNNGKPNGLLDSAPRWALFSGMLLFTLPVLFAFGPLRAGWDKFEAAVPQRRLVLVLTLSIIPVLVVLGLARLLHMDFALRYVAFCIAPYYVLVGRGLSNLRPPALRHFAVAAALAYSAWSLHANFFVPYKENYRDALRYVSREYRAGDCCVFVPFGTVPLQWPIYLGTAARIRTVDTESAASGTASCGRVWLVAYRRVPLPAVDQAIQRIGTTHWRERLARFFWIDVELYIPKQLPPNSPRPPLAAGEVRPGASPGPGPLK